jgi:HD-GYP domain-containing protein (c-di-GMP phosphodiesterase class II)
MALEMSPYRLNNEMALLGKNLVAQLFVLFKTSLNYSEGHAAIESPAANVLKVVREILRRNEEAALRVKGGHFYLGELRLKPDSVGFEAGRFVMEEMKRHLVGGISFSLAVTVEDLRRFVYAFRDADAVPTPDSYTKILERMQQRMIVNIEVETLPEVVETVEIDKERLQDGKLKARLLYKKAVSAMDEVMGNASAEQTLRLRESKRVVQHMVDLLSSYESSLLGMTTMRCHDAYTQNHAANVCILSLVMGKRLGMSKFHLCELGMAALFHDIGKADIPPAILNKPGELSPQEQQIMEAHPLYGVKKIMKLKGLDALSSRIITGVFEHHLLADFSGYPRFPYKRLSLFGRIISIADCYDGLTSSRVSGRTPYPPDKALRFMLTQAGKAYDQGLLKLFINCIGIHGIGSLLLLDTRELAVVVEKNPDPAQWDNPRVKIIADSNGLEVDGEVVDLAHPGPSRMIIATLDPNLFKLDISRYFL